MIQQLQKQHDKNCTIYANLFLLYNDITIQINSFNSL